MAVLKHNRADSLEREVVLVKLSTEPTALQREGMTEGQVFNLAHDRRQALLGIAQLFDAKVADIGSRHAILQLTSWPKRYPALAQCTYTPQCHRIWFTCYPSPLLFPSFR